MKLFLHKKILFNYWVFFIPIHLGPGRIKSNELFLNKKPLSIDRGIPVNQFNLLW